ncbi:UNVERIFIED_CONTAM: IQ domain-containing protein IQM3 [Sesamum calycinum]|uniref:IQ domain-containing protein IQM3 n=1 Tax=Sesamum calycinum TaxID=2727403 RepID=A0AAW2LV30_9LAMI
MDISNQAAPKSDLQSAQETNCFQAIKAAVKLQKVGKGLVEDAKAQKLAFQHWIEAIDPRHRYGHNLHIYFDEWCRSHTDQPFFYWLDVGDGKGSILMNAQDQDFCKTASAISDLECYEYIIVEGELMHKQTGHLLDTNEEVTGSKWIFVMSTSGKLYAGEKKKGRFHHSSFLAGGATLAAGRLAAERGSLKSISAYSGHYRPTDANLSIFLAFLQTSGVNLDKVQVTFCTEYQSYDADSSACEGKTRLPTESEQPGAMNPMIALQQSLKLCRLSTEETQGSLKNNQSVDSKSKNPADDEVQDK